ncbi:MAG: hypothetical protein KIT27_01925 [Legionellales bacterium]|nr:hypothetical protein [Legionellales bacterium]
MNANNPKQEVQISAIINSEQKMENLVKALMAHGFAMHDIVVQASAEKLDKQFSQKYIDPKKLQKNPRTPKSFPLLRDELGWTLGFMIGLPMFFIIILGLLLFGDGDSIAHNYRVLLVSVVVGLIPGSLLAQWYHHRRTLREHHQFQHGGKVIWIHAIGQNQIDQANSLLKKCHAKMIREQFLQYVENHDRRW